MSQAKSLRDCSQPEFDEKLGRIKELRDLRKSYLDKVAAIKESIKGLDCKTEAELDAKIKAQENLISGGGISIREEKIVVSEISKLRAQREKIKGFEGYRETMAEAEAEASKIKSIIDELDGDFSIIKGERESATKILNDFYNQLKAAEKEAEKVDEEYKVGQTSNFRLQTSRQSDHHQISNTLHGDMALFLTLSPSLPNHRTQSTERTKLGKPWRLRGGRRREAPPTFATTASSASSCATLWLRVRSRRLRRRVRSRSRRALRGSPPTPSSGRTTARRGPNKGGRLSRSSYPTLGLPSSAPPPPRRQRAGLPLMPLPRLLQCESSDLLSSTLVLSSPCPTLPPTINFSYPETLITLTLPLPPPPLFIPQQASSQGSREGP